MARQGSRGAGIAILSVIVIFSIIGLFARRGATPAGPGSAENLNQKGIGLAAYSVLDDVQTELNGGDSVSAGAGTFLPLFQIDASATAKDYEAAYDANEISADNKFKRKKILISGAVVSVEKDFTDEGYLVLKGAGLMGVHARLSDTGSAEAASFARGQKVDLVCEGSERVVTVATLGSCETFEGYRNRISPSLDQAISNFLLGRTALSKDAATIITMMYVSALDMPNDSPCLNGVTKSCEAELKGILADKSKRPMIESQTRQMLASLKVK